MSSKPTAWSASFSYWPSFGDRPVMTCIRRRVARLGMVMGSGFLAVALAGCHGILDVSDPTLIRDQDIANASGANGRRLNAESKFLVAVGPTASDVSFFTDERGYDNALSRLGANDAYALDSRDANKYLTIHGSAYDEPHLGVLDQIITKSALAIPQIRLYSPDSVKGDFLAQLFAYRGYSIAQMAEDICPGFPINDVTADNIPILSDQYPTDSALAYAKAQLDSALVHAKDSAVYLNLARVTKGRVLLDLGRYAEAAAAVADVPDDFVYLSNPNFTNTFYVCPSCNWNTFGYPIGDGEGRNGLHFVSENDVVRSPVRYMRQRLSDANVPGYASTKYASSNAQYVISSGTEARLIEAEAALNAHDVSWLDKLNALRDPAGLAPLVDPGTDSARVDLIYHERAFWMFLTGRRLGDLRRLIRNYHRDPEQTFPSGVYPLGGTYGNATAIPFNATGEALYNPKILTGCTTP